MENLRIEKIKNQPGSGPWSDKSLIPYKTYKGEYCWRIEGDTKDMDWPGFKPPSWAKDLICFKGVWYWASDE